MDVRAAPPVTQLASANISRLTTARSHKTTGTSGKSRDSGIHSSNRRKVTPSTAISEVSESTVIDMRRDAAGLPQMPTYQLTPTCNSKQSQIKKIAQDTMKLYLDDTLYDPEICRQKTKDISRAITEKVKKLSLTRFKVVTVVNIGNLNDCSAVNISSRSVWDEKTDKFVSSEYYNKSLYCLAMVYTLYKV